MLDILTIFILLIIFDIPYLFFSKDFYGGIVKNIQKSPMNIRYFSVIIVYIIMALGIKFLVINNSKSLWDAIFYGAILGLFGYGIYDFTNYAIFTNWTINAVMIDVLWGIILSSFVSGIYYYFTLF